MIYISIDNSINYYNIGKDTNFIFIYFSLSREVEGLAL